MSKIEHLRPLFTKKIIGKTSSLPIFPSYDNIKKTAI